MYTEESELSAKPIYGGVTARERPKGNHIISLLCVEEPLHVDLCLFGNDVTVDSLRKPGGGGGG